MHRFGHARNRKKRWVDAFLVIHPVNARPQWEVDKKIERERADGRSNRFNNLPFFEFCYIFEK